MVSESGTNNWSAPRTLFFVKAPAATDLQGMTYIASVDSKVVETGTVDSNSGTITLNIDLSAVPNGFHSLNVVLVSKNGVATDIRNAYFWKLHTGGNRIIRYEYWLNNGINWHEEEVSSTDNPYVLDGYLDLGEDVFSPESYYFVIKNGKPYAYAKNTLTIRFYDADYQSTEISKTFVDYSVGGELTGESTGQQGFSAIVPGESTTFREPAADAICWFQFFANEGDIINLYTSRACQLEVLLMPADSGEQLAKGSRKTSGEVVAEEVFSTKDASRNGEFIAPATGTYYVGIHNMATQSGGNVTLWLTATTPPEIPTSVKNIGDMEKEGSLYDLQGRELPEKPDKGVYIKNHRKVTAK